MTALLPQTKQTRKKLLKPRYPLGKTDHLGRVDGQGGVEASLDGDLLAGGSSAGVGEGGHDVVRGVSVVVVSRELYTFHAKAKYVSKRTRQPETSRGKV